MRSSPCAMPPLCVKVAEVVLVGCLLGGGDRRWHVLQVFHSNGDLLIEHDRIHEDPVYVCRVLRDGLSKGPHEG